MDVAAEFGVVKVLLYYSRLCKVNCNGRCLRQGITTNTLNFCFPHMNRYWHKQSLTHRVSSKVELFSHPNRLSCTAQCDSGSGLPLFLSLPQVTFKG